MTFALRYLHICWYLPKDICISSDIYPKQIFAGLLIFSKDLCTSVDICPKIFEHILIFAQIFLHVWWYSPTDLCMFTDICPKIFARLLTLAHRSSHIDWYLPKDLRTPADICPKIFVHLLIFARRSTHVFWYLPNDLRSYQFSIKFVFDTVCLQTVLNNSNNYWFTIFLFGTAKSIHLMYGDGFHECGIKPFTQM